VKGKGGGGNQTGGPRVASTYQEEKALERSNSCTRGGSGGVASVCPKKKEGKLIEGLEGTFNSQIWRHRGLRRHGNGEIKKREGFFLVLRQRSGCWTY